MLLVEPSPVTLFTDGRFTIQARQEAFGVRTTYTGEGRSWPLLAPTCAARAVFEPPFRPHGLVLRVGPSQEGWGEGCSLVAVDGLVDKLRAVKIDGIDRIRDAARIGSEVMEETYSLCGPV